MRALTPEEWAKAGHTGGEIPHSWWAPLIRVFPMGSVLCELGCGPGATMCNLAMASMRYEFVAIDFSTDLLMHARQALALVPSPPARARFVHQDVLDDNPLPTADYIYSVGLLEHFEDGQIAHVIRKSWDAAKYGIVHMVPNAACRTYGRWMEARIQNGDWPYGLERPIADFMPFCEDLPHLVSFSQCSVGDSFVDVATDERYLRMMFASKKAEEYL